MVNINTDWQKHKPCFDGTVRSVLGLYVDPDTSLSFSVDKSFVCTLKLDTKYSVKRGLVVALIEKEKNSLYSTNPYIVTTVDSMGPGFSYSIQNETTTYTIDKYRPEFGENPELPNDISVHPIADVYTATALEKSHLYTLLEL
jgi:hypothetical protein